MENNIQLKIIIPSCLFIVLVIIHLSAQDDSKISKTPQISIQKAIKQTEKLLAETRTEKDQAFRQLELIRSQMNYRKELQKQIVTESKSYNQEIVKMIANIETQKSELKSVQLEYFRLLKKKLVHRITYNPVLGLFQKENLENQVKRWYFIQLMEEQRKNTLSQLDELQKSNKFSMAQLEQKKQSNDSLLTLSQHEEECLYEDEAYYKNLVNEMNTVSNKLNSSLLAYKKKKDELSLFISGKMNLLPDRNKKTKLDYSKYRLSYPMEFPTIVSRFGRNMESGQSQLIIKNNGIDMLSADPFIKSAHEAQVVQIRKMPSQNYLLITKYEDLYIVYSNLQNVLLKEGENISLGTHIGKAIQNEQGNYELHFETWHDKTPVNPLNFIK